MGRDAEAYHVHETYGVRVERGYGPYKSHSYDRHGSQVHASYLHSRFKDPWYSRGFATRFNSEELHRECRERVFHVLQKHGELTAPETPLSKLPIVRTVRFEKNIGNGFARNGVRITEIHSVTIRLQWDSVRDEWCEITMFPDVRIENINYHA